MKSKNKNTAGKESTDSGSNDRNGNNTNKRMLDKVITIGFILAILISIASAFTTYIFTPTGGVIAPIVVTIVNIIENHTGSNPNASPNGKNIGTVRTKNPKASTKHPPIKYISKTNSRIK